MTHEVDTAFDRTFSEPPNVVVATDRTRCDACGATLDASVMHKCAGNEEYKPPQASSMPDLANYRGVCPQCHGKKPEPDSQEELCGLCAGSGEIK